MTKLVILLSALKFPTRIPLPMVVAVPVLAANGRRSSRDARPHQTVRSIPGVKRLIPTLALLLRTQHRMPKTGIQSLAASPTVLQRVSRKATIGAGEER